MTPSTSSINDNDKYIILLLYYIINDKPSHWGYIRLVITIYFNWIELCLVAGKFLE